MTSAGVSGSISEADALSLPPLGEPSDAERLEAMESLENWDFGTAVDSIRPLMSDEEILASVGAQHLVAQHNSDSMVSALSPQEEVEDFL